MTTLQWDQLGDRVFEVGVEKGVLYVNGFGVPWNGLIAVEESFPEASATSYYFEGQKFNQITSTADFQATLRAYTYPDQFSEVEGTQEIEDSGFYVTAQTPKLFGLSYRTMIGNDLDAEAGYKLHVVCNASAVPQQRAYRTNSANPAMIEFAWTINAVPSRVPGYRPSAHLIFDSTKMDGTILQAIEDVLYGTEDDNAYLPPFVELVSLLDIDLP